MIGVPQLPHPFEVFFDEESEKYYIFAPDGCILVDGKEIAIYGASNGNVELSLGSSMPDCLYAHVTADANSTGGYKAEFDGNATKSGAKWNFRVTRFGAAENDGNQYDIATGAINLGGSAVPGNFEPIFDSNQKLVSIGEGFCPVGRKFDTNVLSDPNESYKIEEGVIYIEVNHPTSSSSSPTLYLKGAASAGVLFANSDTTKTNIPLYKIKGGEIVVDYRSAMSMTLREL